ncbi:MAG: hypothetical protein R3A49_03545 [Acidimicrobiia bacterium]
MFRRLFWLMVGFGLGLGLAVLTFRRIDAVLNRYAPPQVADQLATSAKALGRDVREAVLVGRAAMREREAELRSEVGVSAPGVGVGGR